MTALTPSMIERALERWYRNGTKPNPHVQKIPVTWTKVDPRFVPLRIEVLAFCNGEIVHGSFWKSASGEIFFDARDCSPDTWPMPTWWMPMPDKPKEMK